MENTTEMKRKEERISRYLCTISNMKKCLYEDIREGYLIFDHPSGADDPYFSKFDKILDKLYDDLTDLECHLYDEVFEISCIPF